MADVESRPADMRTGFVTLIDPWSVVTTMGRRASAIFSISFRVGCDLTEDGIVGYRVRKHVGKVDDDYSKVVGRGGSLSERARQQAYRCGVGGVDIGNGAVFQLPSVSPVAQHSLFREVFSGT